MLWTLQRNSETPLTLASWNFEACAITFTNQTPGSFSAGIKGNALATSTWTHGDKATLRKDGVIYWRGYFERFRRRLTGPAELMEALFLCPLSKLSRGGAYKQTLFFPSQVENINLGLIAQTRVSLFAEITPGESWTRRTIAAELAEIISQANTRHGGNVLQLGDTPASLAVTPDPRELRDATFAEAMRTALEFAPDVISQWDFTTTPPTLHFRNRSNATTRTHALGADFMIESDILPRHDIKLDGVHLRWTYEAQGDGPTYELTALEDTAGNVTGSNVLEQTIALTPPRFTPGITERAEVISETYNINSADFWKKYGGIPAEAVDVAVESGTSITPLDAFNKILLGGQIPGWLNREAHIKEATITGKLAYKVWIDPSNTAKGYQVNRETKNLRIQTTDLSGDYTNTVQAPFTEPGDDPIPGLAAHFFDALGTLQYEGAVTWHQDNPEINLQPGDLLNITDGLDEWEEMAAQVHQVRVEIDTGKTVASLGPDEFLGVADFIALQRSQRRRELSANLNARATGAAPSREDGTVNHGTPVDTTKTPSNAPIPTEFENTANNWLYKWKIDGGLMEMRKEDSTKSFKLDTNAGTLEFKDTTSTEKRFKIDLSTATLLLKNGDKECSIDLVAMEALLKESATKQLSLKPDTIVAQSTASHKATINAEDGFKITDGTNTGELTTTTAEVTDGTNTATLAAADGLTHTDGTATANLAAADGLAHTDGTSTLTANAADGAEHVAAGSTAALSAANGATHTDGTATATLKSNNIAITDGTNTATTTAADGYSHTQTGFTLSIAADAGYSNTGSGGSVEIQVQPGEAIELRETDFCDEDGSGNPITKTAHILSGEPEAA